MDLSICCFMMHVSVPSSTHFPRCDDKGDVAGSGVSCRDVGDVGDAGGVSDAGDVADVGDVADSDGGGGLGELGDVGDGVVGDGDAVAKCSLPLPCNRKQNHALPSGQKK